MRSQLLITTAVLVTLGAASPTAARDAAATKPAVRPNPDEQTLATQTRSSTPARTASPAVQPNPDEQAATSAGMSTGRRSEVIDNAGYATENLPPVVVHVITPTSGFEWADAGIGAAGGLGLATLGVACVLRLSQRRARRE